MANIGEKAISILAGNLNSGLSYFIITVTELYTLLSGTKSIPKAQNAQKRN